MEMVTVGWGRKCAVRSHSNKLMRHTVNVYAVNLCEKAHNVRLPLCPKDLETALLL